MFVLLVFILVWFLNRGIAHFTSSWCWTCTIIPKRNHFHKEKFNLVTHFTSKLQWLFAHCNDTLQWHMPLSTRLDEYIPCWSQSIDKAKSNTKSFDIHGFTNLSGLAWWIHHHAQSLQSMNNYLHVPCFR